MIDPTEMKEFQHLVSELIEDYVGKRNYDIDDFKRMLKNLIDNPLSSDKKIYKLIDLLGEKGLESGHFEEVWDKMEKIIGNTFQKNEKIRKDFFQERFRTHEKRLVDFMIEMMASKGSNESLMLITAYLVIHKKLTQSQLKRLTGLSQGTISETLSRSVKYGHVKKERIEGTRTFQYSLGESMRSIAKNISSVKMMKGKEIEGFVRKKLEELKMIEDSSKKGSKLLLERLNELKQYSKISQEILQEITKSKPMLDIIGEEG